MLKKLTTMLASALICNTLAAATPELAASLDYKLLPNEPTIIRNITFQTIKGECIFSLSEEFVVVNVKVLTRSGEVDGRVVKEGDEFDIIVRNGSKMTMTAKSAAQVQLLNKGESTINAHCYTI